MTKHIDMRNHKLKKINNGDLVSLAKIHTEYVEV